MDGAFTVTPINHICPFLEHGMNQAYHIPRTVLQSYEWLVALYDANGSKRQEIVHTWLNYVNSTFIKNKEN